MLFPQRWFLLACCLLSALAATVKATRLTYATSQTTAGISQMLSSTSNAEVLFQFDSFPLANRLIEKSQSSFLRRFVQDQVSVALQDDTSIDDVARLVNEEKLFKVEELIPAGELLYNYSPKGNGPVIFQFTSDSYDLAQLNDFIESVLLLLQELPSTLDNVMFNFPAQDAEAELNLPYSRGYSLWRKDNNLEVESDTEEEEEEDGDPDILSKIWTEGLLMCLIVSAILITILIGALSWLSSIEISYGALEKSTNPLKKTN